MMNCFKPIHILDPDWVHYLSEHGIEPFELSPSIRRLHEISVPCGRCEACLQSVANEWRIRIQEEFYVSQNALFFTLTYQDDKVPILKSWNAYDEQVFVRSVCKRDIQLFLKRIREEIRKEFPHCKLRYYICSEYGPSTFRPHYHGILFNLPCYEPNNLVSLKKSIDLLFKCWSNGFVSADKVIPERIGYVTKYLCSTSTLPPELNRKHTKPFRMMSQGLGRSYFQNASRYFWHKDGLNNYYPDGNVKCALPRYFKRKIFDDEELVKLRDKSSEYYQKNYAAVHPRDVDCFNRTGSSFNEQQMIKFKRNFKNKYVKKRKDI